MTYQTLAPLERAAVPAPSVRFVEGPQVVGFDEDGERYRPERRTDPSARGGPRPAGVPSRRETAGYIAEMCEELSDLARASDLVFLAYLLDMAREEANRLGPR